MRTILHSDANSFYASVETVYDPSLRNVPLAVCGDPEARHGIILTKNQLAKQAGVNVRTLQDYEQGRKDINQAAAITVYKLSEALGCSVWELLEDE